MLGRNFIFITAKLLKPSRITNVEWLNSSAPIAQMPMLAAVYIFFTPKYINKAKIITTVSYIKVIRCPFIFDAENFI